LVNKIPLLVAGFIVMILGIIIIFYELFLVIPNGGENMIIWGVGLIIGVIFTITGLIAIWYGVEEKKN
jgi:hypothetical protein